MAQKSKCRGSCGVNPGLVRKRAKKVSADTPTCRFAAMLSDKKRLLSAYHYITPH
jgi:hypothetical protein